jgi:hypothetical protein
MGTSSRKDIAIFQSSLFKTKLTTCAKVAESFHSLNPIRVNSKRPYFIIKAFFYIVGVNIGLPVCGIGIQFRKLLVIRYTLLYERKGIHIFDSDLVEGSIHHLIDHPSFGPKPRPMPNQNLTVG